MTSSITNIRQRYIEHYIQQINSTMSADSTPNSSSIYACLLEDAEEINRQVVSATEALKAIDTNITTDTIIPAPREQIKVVVNTDLLDERVSNLYKTPLHDCNDDILSPPISTTTTLSGILSNLVLDEHNINAFEPNDRVIIIESNFGTKMHSSIEGIIKPTATSKSTRGRKPKVKEKKKERKKQGSGKCFNSQITFVVKTDIVDSSTITGYKEYKFKVFRNNKEQLPGARPEYLSEILAANNEVIALLNQAFVPADNPNKIKLVSLSACMKNYKFYLKMYPHQILDLGLLKQIFLIERLKDSTRGQYTISDILKINCNCGEKICINCFNKDLLGDERLREVCDIDDSTSPPHPVIFDVRYTYEDTKMSIIFHTPLDDNPKKTIRVNIFPGNEIPTDYSEGIAEGTYGGKINILGALHESTTKEIYQYLLYMFDKYYNDVVVDRTITSSEYAIVVDNDDNDTDDNITDDSQLTTTDMIDHYVNTVIDSQYVGNAHITKPARVPIIALNNATDNIMLGVECVSGVADIDTSTTNNTTTNTTITISQQLGTAEFSAIGELLLTL